MNAFDIAAASYDTDFTHTANGWAQRLQVRFRLEKFLAVHPVESVLEVNCGTGEDALWLSSKGIDVTATDISNGMIQTALSKSGSGNCMFRCEDMSALPPDLQRGNFDLLFSNFGGLNCLSPKQLRSFFAHAATAVKPGGHIALVVMPRQTVWERLYFGWKNDIENARRRMSGRAIADISGQKVETWYYDPAEVTTAAIGFEKISLAPIGLFTPPSYLENLTRNRKWLAWILAGLDRVFARAAWPAPYADHFFILLRRS